jgi:leader peptidase (prepilin peptidase)/N-methyltransferase
MTELPVAFWATFAGLLGASVGSFLNVVAYRVPRGLSLSHPPSACPRCDTRIRARHNVPVLGWLVLRGRCFDCHLPISVRYPLVEAGTGGLVAAVTFGVLSYQLPWQVLPPVAAAALVLVCGLSGANRRGAHRR